MLVSHATAKELAKIISLWLSVIHFNYNYFHPILKWHWNFYQ